MRVYWVDLCTSHGLMADVAIMELQDSFIIQGDQVNPYVGLGCTDSHVKYVPEGTEMTNTRIARLYANWGIYLRTGEYIVLVPNLTSAPLLALKSPL